MRGLTRIAATSIAMAVIGLASSGAASASPASTEVMVFADQARAAGLTTSQVATLQNEVDATLAETGGRQVAVNRIEFDGGAIQLAIPGEDTARDLAEPVGALHTCVYKFFCAYSAPNFTGSFMELYTCGTYGMPWASNGSWKNNQTTGVRAKFRDAYGDVIFTTPPAYSARPTNVNWTPVYYITNC
jgi:hypothetical protein